MGKGRRYEMKLFNEINRNSGSGVICYRPDCKEKQGK